MFYPIERVYCRICDVFNTVKHRLLFRNPTLRCGKGVRIRTTRISFGINVSIDRGVEIGGAGTEGFVQIGDDVQINRDCKIDCTGRLEIGSRVTISEQVIIYTHSHGSDPRSKDRPHTVTIGDNSWLGARAIILSSARKIGKDSIVGAGVVQRTPVDDNSVSL